ncbi:hypothetical protein F5Y01DRAFT_273600 [Xylaria sp. FL0043]|nr:hypothetical protein F5Y01DRAFT_273600 [Xylaria sp. FL0043]
MRDLVSFLFLSLSNLSSVLSKLGYTTSSYTSGAVGLGGGNDVVKVMETIVQGIHCEGLYGYAPACLPQSQINCL